MCFIYFFRSSTEPAVFAQCVWATLAQLLGSASPDVRLRVRGVAVTDSVRFCGGGFDSFLGFEYGVVITLASGWLLYSCGCGSHGVGGCLVTGSGSGSGSRSFAFATALLLYKSTLLLRCSFLFSYFPKSV